MSGGFTNRMKFSQKWLLIAICVGFISVSCNKNGERSSENTVVHPIEKNIPYFDRNHIEVSKTKRYSEGDLPSHTLNNLFRFLQSSAYTGEKLSLMTGVSLFTDVLFKDENNLVILDSDRNALFQYGIQTGLVDSIAGQGQGPGDLNYSQEMIRDEDFIYIAMEDMKISRFDCRPEICEYDKTIPLNGSALSIAKVEEKFAVLGHHEFNPLDDYEVGNAISLVNGQGEIEQRFGRYYNAEQYIVFISLRQGTVRYSSSLEKYLFAMDYLPIIYAFNNRFELSETYKLTGSIQGEVIYDRRNQSANFPAQKKTSTTDITLLDNDVALIHTLTLTEARFDENSEGPSFIHDYYAINLTTLEGYYLGEHSGEYLSRIYPSEHGIILNDGEAVYLIE